MGEFSQEQLRGILSRAEFDELKGQYENQWFDAKKEPYQLQFERQKAELAKDVAAFANLDGGWILIGVRTETEDEFHFGDVVKEIHPFAPSLVNTDQMLKILQAMVVPFPEGLTVNWIPSSFDASKGIVSIEIPKQHEESKPFLHYYVNDTDKKDSIYVGFARRVGSTTQSQSISDIQKWLRDGFNYGRNIANRLDELRDLVQSPPIVVPNESFDSLVASANKKKVDHITKSGISEERLLVITGFLPKKRSEVSFVNSDLVIGSLEGLTRGLRNGGWKALYSSEIVERSPAVIRTLRKDLKSVDLFVDGTALFECNLNVLCFLSGELMGSPPRIVPVALAETVFQFVRFYFEYLSLIDNGENQCFFQIDLINMFKDGEKTLLPSHTAAPMTLTDDYEAPDNEFQTTVEVEISSAERGCYILLSEIYKWFGLDHYQIPFSGGSDGSAYTDLSFLISPES